MASFLQFRPSLSWYLCVPNVHLMSLLLAMSLVGLQGSDCFSGSDRRASATTMRQPFTWPEQGRKQDSDHIPWLGGPLAAESHGGAAPVRLGLATGPQQRVLSFTKRARDARSLAVSGDSNATRAPPDVEVEALSAFKAAVVSDPSNALRSWIVGPAAGNNSDTCTRWVGVTCAPQFPFHVVGLNLSNLQLVGSLNSVLPTLGHLPFLQTLDLSDNVFSGSIQGQPLTNLSHLSYFNVSINVITGEIPSKIGELVSLRDLDISNNNISGPIPESLSNCSLLRSIRVGQNFLEGVIPDWLGTLSGLEFLNLSSNSLSGSIPGAIGNCSSLRVLNLNYNYHLGGGSPLPPEMSLLKKLTYFGGEQAYYISGDFPPWIGNLTSLVEFTMYENNLFSEIPDTIGQLKFLKSFSVAVNQMTGVIPPSIYNLTLLKTLQIEGTMISGHIPSQIGMLSNLGILGLAQNQLTGVIPSSLANCSSLTYLILGQNLWDPQPVPPWMEFLTNLSYVFLSYMNLQGEIPQGIGKLINLNFFTLASNDLIGTIPIALQNCSQLAKIDMSNNNLTGDVPQELGELRYMSIFYASNNYLRGSYPDCIHNWTNLDHIELDWNFLSGPLDGRLNFDKLQQLSSFSVAGNNFSGPIPEAISNCTSLIVLQLDSNHFTGPIPPSLGNLTSLQRLNLSDNNLQGPIPVSILESALQLSVLDLAQNKLEGSIPLEIGQLTQLTSLYLHTNKLSGIVPDSIGNCSTISKLDLSGNQLEGNIPAAAVLNMAGSITLLNLSHNLFAGTWPSEFAQLKVIQAINVSSNNISGSIPLGLGQCLALVVLDISMNNLTGEIPQDIGLLKHLEFFNASFNYFTGPIPQQGIFNSNRINESSFLGNPGLCGPVATVGPNHQQCVAIPTNVSTHDPNCKGFSCKQVWIPVAVVSTLLLLGAGVCVTVGVRLGWTFTRDHFKKQVLLNFEVHMRFTEKDLIQTIDDPGGNNVIGAGARSIVYRGVLPGGQMFALKKLLPIEDDHANDNGSSSEGANEIIKEAKILAKLRHKNILKYMGFYSDLDHKALIVEYMSGGSLHKHLHEVEPCLLTWQARLKIAIGVAQGLKYLHHDFPEPLIHRDLKPSNIFLDEDSEPKVGDFGISKFVGPHKDGEASASTFCGTIGYMPPEYASQSWVSTKGDVYSYGMTIIELLTRKHPCSTNALEDQDTDLRSWVLDCFHERPFESLDPLLAEECGEDSTAKEQLMLLLRLSLFCTRAEPQSRPSMINVVGMLTYITNLGTAPVIRRTLEELANDNDSTMWVSQDPTIEGTEFGSTC